MAMNFPPSPAIGQPYSVSGGPTYTWDGNVWKVLTPGQQYSPQQFTATAGQTTFTVSGGYVIGAIDVFRNGVKLVNGQDFTATDLATVVLSNACSAGDTVEVITLSQIVYSAALKNSNNLSDVSNAATALANLGGLPKAGGTVTGPVTFNGLVSNAAAINRHSFSTTNQGGTHSRYEIMRIARDPGNWGAIPVEVTVFNNYYRGGVSKWFISYNQVDSGTVTCLSCSGTNQHKVFLGSEVTVSANLRYVPVIVEIPYYSSVSIEVATTGVLTSSITAAWQYQLTGTYTTGDGTYHNGSIDAIGIKFPASQNQSSDANTLDDYEEGTWNPVYWGGAGNPTVTYGNQNGTYVKIGKLVMLSFEVSANSASGGGGTLQIGGFPFAAYGTRYQGGLTVTFSQGFASAGYAPRQGYVYTGWTSAYLTYFTANNNQMEVSVSNLNTAGSNYIIGHVVYMTAT